MFFVLCVFFFFFELILYLEEAENVRLFECQTNLMMLKIRNISSTTFAAIFQIGIGLMKYLIFILL